MQLRTYLVGGAVRDRLLGRPIADRDYVVVGATPDDLLRLGYKPVGKDFPVFLHPHTKEEHALARTERKSGPGYHGFTFHAAPDVTLEQDLARRDLTINAMAEDEHGNLVDPFGGARDVAERWLRHASPAFVEDPVRVLRVARFAARYAPLGFRVAPETEALMRTMVANGEVEHLVPERVWQETRKALAEPRPSAFVRTLRECGALAVLFPEVDRLYGVPQRAEHHPEVDTGVHLELVLDMAATLAPGDARVGYCALLHDLGKGLTPAAELPKHVMHETTGVPLVAAVNARLKVPAEFATLATLVCKLHLTVHKALEIKASTVLKLLERVDAFRRPERLAPLLTACEADKRGRLGLQHRPYPQRDYLTACHAAAASVGAKPFVEQGLVGAAIGAAVRLARLRAIQSVPKPAQPAHELGNR
jgi:tRNA nucleotidyltransferase (CCA-adding enzyme)